MIAQNIPVAQKRKPVSLATVVQCDRVPLILALVCRICGTITVLWATWDDKHIWCQLPKVANMVCAQNLFKRKGAKPILQVTVCVE